MLLQALRFVRILPGLALAILGLDVLVRGGMSFSPLHLYWRCIALGLAMAGSGVFLAFKRLPFLRPRGA